jgi:hypothetical protein
MRPHPGVSGCMGQEYCSVMPPLGDDAPTWDVLPIANRDEEIDRYRPPAADRRDPVRLVGRAETGPEKARHALRAVFIALLVGSPMASLGPRTVGWYVATGAVMMTIILVRLVFVLRHPSGGRPEVTVSSEGLTVTDVHGVTRRVAWSDAGNLFIGWYSPRQVRELYVTWVESTGEHIVNNLGHSLDLEEVSTAVLSRAPENVSLRLGPQRAHGYFSEILGAARHTSRRT